MTKTERTQLRKLYSKCSEEQLKGALVYHAHRMDDSKLGDFYRRHAEIIEELLDQGSLNS